MAPTPTDVLQSPFIHFSYHLEAKGNSSVMAVYNAVKPQQNPLLLKGMLHCWQAVFPDLPSLSKLVLCVAFSDSVSLKV